jgi:hypothetical protein
MKTYIKDMQKEAAKEATKKTGGTCIVKDRIIVCKIFTEFS